MTMLPPPIRTLAPATTKGSAAVGLQPGAPTSLGQRLAQGGNRALDASVRGHLAAIAKTGVGTYFGSDSEYRALRPEQRAAWLKQHAKRWDQFTPEQKHAWAAQHSPGFSALSPEDQRRFLSNPALSAVRATPAPPRQSNCIEWAMEVVGGAYAAAGQSARWQEIVGVVRRSGMKGTELAKELQKDGWSAIYWNPDAANPNDGLAEHRFTAAQAQRGNPYYGLRVDGTVLNFKPSGKGSPKTVEDRSGLRQLEQVPFYFGLAKGGMHTFVGRHGKVADFHWEEDPNSKSAITEQPLRGWEWNSGVMLVPPGLWPAPAAGLPAHRAR